MFSCESEPVMLIALVSLSLRMWRLCLLSSLLSVTCSRPQLSTHSHDEMINFINTVKTTWTVRGLLCLLCCLEVIYWCTCSLSLPLSDSSLSGFFTGGCELPEHEVRTSEVSLRDDAEGPAAPWHVSDHNHIILSYDIWGFSRSLSKLVINKMSFSIPSRNPFI